MRIVCLLALLLVPLLVVAQDKPEPPPRKWTYGSFGVAMRADLTIYQGGARNAAGEVVVTVDDRLLAWDGKELKTLDDFCRALYATKPGQEVEITFERPVKDSKEKSTIKATIKLGDPRTQFANLYTSKEKRQRSFDWKASDAAKSATPLRTRAMRELTDGKLLAQWEAVIAAHERELDLWDCYESTSACELLLKDPLASDAFVRAATDAMAGDQGKGIVAAHALASRLLDRAAEPWAAPQDLFPKAATTKPEAARQLGGNMDIALGLLDSNKEARASLGAEAWADLLRQVQAFEFAWAGEDGHDKCAALVKAMREAGLQPAAALPKAGFALDKIESMAIGYWNQKEAGAQMPIFPDIDTSKFVQGSVLCYRCEYGVIAIGGKDRNVWIGGPDAPAVIVDLGGDDDYTDLGVTDSGHPVQVIIDLGGNDRYRSTTKWGVAAGVLGTAIIDDRNGDDLYECAQWGIGAAFGGVGLILDAKGNDRYLGGTYGIGCAAYGAGGVIDLEGNDLYDSNYHSIGVGEAGGVGFVLDGAGDDVYRCTGLVPSGYGTAGEWSGWGIGCGFGWRGLAGGGTGVVIDVAGNDIYSAGEFGLGCGYFLGVGMVRDMAGDDIYHSSRYGLAAAAHCAVGLFMDDTGNDTYEGKTAASMAGVWDIVTGYFCDGGGNDIYRCDGLGLGACAMNGVGLFWEGGGDDVYRCGASCLGHGGAAEYGGGRLAKNFGLFFDLGGKDSYPEGKRGNGSKFWESDYGLFADD